MNALKLKRFEVIDSFGYFVLALTLGLLILFVSVSLASYELMAVENGESKLRIDPINFSVSQDDGTVVEMSYKLPEVNTLPNNPFYGFKKLRDQLWLVFSGSGVKKARTSFLLADKKMAEARMLIAEGEIRIALEASQEALEKLKYTDELLSTGNQSKIDEARQIREEVYMAGLAYVEVLKGVESSFEGGGEKYNNIKQELNEFNQKIQEEREERSI